MNRRLTLVFSAAAATLGAIAIGVGCRSGAASTGADMSVGSGRSAITIGSPTLYKDPLHSSPVHGDPGDVLLIPGINFSADAVVVYAAIADTTQPLPAAPHPSTLHASQTSTGGAIVPLAVDDYAVKVVLPKILTAGQSYVLWVANPAQNHGQYHYSNGILINDARPIWISPGPQAGTPYPYVYATTGRPGLDRDLKIVGQNLQPAPAHRTRVRFTSDANTYMLTAADDGVSSRYVARVTIPEGFLQPGNYAVAVSRDDVSWVPLVVDPAHPGTALTVLPDPPTTHSYYVSDFWGDGEEGDGPLCRGDDSLDDTFCITRAIEAARRHSGGDVVFPAGTWTINRSCWEPPAIGAWDPEPINDEYHFPDDLTKSSYAPCEPLWSHSPGILVPPGVNLVSDGWHLTTVQTDVQFVQPLLDYFGHLPGADPTRDPQRRQTLFSLKGNNLVQGLRFHDNFRPTYTDIGTSPGSLSLFLVGDDITITDNFFDDIYMAITGWWHPLNNDILSDSWDGIPVFGHTNLIVTWNTFGSYGAPAFLPVLVDSVVSNNTFWPGASPSPLAAGSLGSLRVDISSNIVDGTITRYSGSQSGKSGWRAGFIFPSRTSHENLLVTHNRISCVGTRDGFDGEAISTDENGDRVGFPSGEWVLGATEDTVTVSSRARLLADDQYKGHWVRVDSGPGFGQTRRITSAVTSEATATIELTVSPPFDVMPVAGEEHSRIVVSQQAWQLYIVNNVIDNTCSTMRADWATSWTGGLIGLSGPAADSVIAGNTQIDTAGIFVGSAYNVIDYHVGTACTAATAGACTGVGKLCLGADGRKVTGDIPGTCEIPSTYWGSYFVDISGNEIQGSFGLVDGLTNPCNSFGSGVQLRGAARWIDSDNVPTYTPDKMNVGISISHNTIRNAALLHHHKFWFQAASSYAPAIAVGWSDDWPRSSATPGFSETLVFRNNISELPTPPTATPACAYDRSGEPLWAGQTTVGILNGEMGAAFPGLTKDPSYPQDTTICETESWNDFPPDGQESSLTICPPTPACGGILNLSCPHGQVCVDDPDDDCIPEHGTSDCPGICLGIPTCREIPP